MLIKEKVTQAINILKEFKIDCWLTFVRESSINGDPSLDYLIASDVTWHSAFVITAKGDSFAIIGKYDKQAVADLGVYKTVIDHVTGLREPLQQVLKQINPSSIAVNYSKDSEIADGLTHGMYLTLVDVLSEIGMQDRMISSEKVVSALRQRKTETEVGLMKEAIKATLQIYDEVFGFIKPGKTEAEVAAFIRSRIDARKLGYAWDPSTCPSVFSGPDTAEAHYAPTERRVQEGHVLNMDFGVKYNQYCSDLQRTVYILKKGETKAPPEVQKGFDTIVESIEESRKAMKPGVLGKDIDAVSRKVLVENGFQEYPHALGHQVGRFAHDGTALLGPAWEKYGRKPFLPLERGMVFTLEPRLTVPERGIATVEEMVVVTNTGAEFLSSPQKELVLIKP
ncbi:MAG TPA: aminopeptidase P family protein [Bacteroidetes bacterium]|jgi:Xaa-Pro aminopeptidase|nr:aminopeptidase P family protein [Bacteroidota bacterium]